MMDSWGIGVSFDYGKLHLLDSLWEDNGTRLANVSQEVMYVLLCALRRIPLLS